jgi:hypothetical protein
MSLIVALHDDLSFDGFFDGIGSNGVLVLPQGGEVRAGGGKTAYRLDGQTVRITLAKAIEEFLKSPRNKSDLTVLDTLHFRNLLAINSNAHMFREAGSRVDDEAPRLTVVGAVPRYTNQTTLTVRLQADDNGGLGVRRCTVGPGRTPSLSRRRSRTGSGRFLPCRWRWGRTA